MRPFAQGAVNLEIAELQHVEAEFFDDERHHVGEGVVPRLDQDAPADDVAGRAVAGGKFGGDRHGNKLRGWALRNGEAAAQTAVIAPWLLSSSIAKAATVTTHDTQSR